jgi:hypothetical protein
MGLPQDERLMQLRLLAGRLEERPPSPKRDELLDRIRLRIAETEVCDDLEPPSSLPALRNEPVSGYWAGDVPGGRGADSPGF